MTEERKNAFAQELKDLDINEVVERIASLDEEVRNATEVQEVEERTDMKALLIERKNELEELEIRKEEVKALEERELEATTIEERKEEVEMEERTFGIETKEYRDAFFKNLMGQELNEVEQRAYASTDSYTAIPTLTSEKMFEKMKKLAPMLDEITLLRASGNIKFVVEDTRNNAYKHTENSAESASADTIITVTLGAYEFMKVIEISKVALKQSIDAFEGFLVNMLAGDIARQIDNYIINDATNGIAKGTYTTNTNQVVGSITYANLTKLVSLLPAGYDAEAKFLTNKATLWNSIANITNSNGTPIFIQDTSAGFGRLLGYPVLVDDYVSTTGSGVYLGNWKDVVGNLSQDVMVESDESAGFYKATVPFRGYATFDSKPAKMDGICRLVTTTSGL